MSFLVPSFRLTLLIVWAGLCWALAPASSLADTRHTVQSGQSMSSIAKRYDVTVWSLAAANGLDPDAAIRVGEVLTVPDKGEVFLQPGQTLWSVARRHGVSVEALAKANGLTSSSTVRPGMRLVLPNARIRAQEAKSARRWGTPAKKGRAVFIRSATDERLVVTLVDHRGRARGPARNQLANLLRPRDSARRGKRPPARLISILADISDHFGGRPLQVISGTRRAEGYTKGTSRHVMGHAIDFRVVGISNRVLRDYLRHFDDVGVGFYPNSTFVHLDVRDENAYWVDTSGPGQKPQYLARAERDSFSTAERLDTGESIEDVIEAAIEELDHAEPESSEALDE